MSKKTITVTKSLGMGMGRGWERRGRKVGKIGEWISLLGNRHPCTELVLWGILRSQTCSKNQRNMTVSHRFKKTMRRITTGGRPRGSKKPFCKAWLSTVLLRIELFL